MLFPTHIHVDTFTTTCIYIYTWPTCVHMRIDTLALACIYIIASKHVHPRGRRDYSVTTFFGWSSEFSFTLQSPFWTLVQSKALKRNNGRLEAVRLPVLAGLPPGGRAALLTPFDKLWYIRLTLH